MVERFVQAKGSKKSEERVTILETQTIERWLADFGTASSEQLIVHRPWATVAGVADRGRLDVVMADGRHSWSLVPPDGEAMAVDAVREVLREALTSAERPRREWKLII